MKIPTILRGDDSGAIAITIPEGRDFTGATLVLAYGGVTRSFTDLVPGQTLSFGFTHDETAGFKLGCKPVLMRLIGPSGAVETVENAAMKIKVTDCLGEVNAGGSFVIRPRDISGGVPVTDLGDLPTTAKIGELYDKVNEIVRVLAQRSLMALALCLGLAAGAGVQTARLEDLDRGSVVVTNVTESGGSGLDTNAVREIVAEGVRDKRDKADLAVYAALTNVAPFGIDHWMVEDFKLSLNVAEDGFAAWSGYGYSVTATRQAGGSLKYHYGDGGAASVDFYFLEGDLEIYYEQPDYYVTNHVKAVMKVVDALALASEVADATNGLATAAEMQTLAAQVTAIGAHLNAEDARFVATNYNSSTHMPEAYVEVKVDGNWVEVWREMTRWNWLFDNYLPTNYASKAELDEKADRAWGFYDSHGGNFAPDGYTWISSPRIAIAAGMAYQRTITSEGAIWVLECNGEIVETSGTTNGFFRVLDDEGNAQFEIVKGGKRTVGADAGGVNYEAVSGSLIVTYSVVADEHPIVYVTRDLAEPNWIDETSDECPATVTWSGASGAWIATVKGKGTSPKLFVRATYQVGGESYIKNNSPVSMQKIIIDGVQYRIGTVTISGHKVLTLTED